MVIHALLCSGSIFLARATVRRSWPTRGAVESGVRVAGFGSPLPLTVPDFNSSRRSVIQVGQSGDADGRVASVIVESDWIRVRTSTKRSNSVRLIRCHGRLLECLRAVITPSRTSCRGLLISSLRSSCLSCHCRYPR